MKEIEILENLEKIAEKLGVKVIYDKMWGKGGGCRLRQKRYILINKTLSNREKIKVFAGALSCYPLDDIYIIPKVREQIEKAREE